MKIYFCTTAPSNNYKSWSNIPFFFQKHLEKKGFTVNNYVMREIEPLKSVFNFPVRLLNKFFNLGSTYFYVRTPVHFFFTYLYSRYIGMVSDHKDVMVVQGFSYPLHNGKNKQIIFGDWPSEYLFDMFLKRKPSRLERWSIDRENAVIEAADAVITLFPNVQQYMLKKYKNDRIYCYGNVVNVDDNINVPVNVVRNKIKSNRLLFIGQPFYIQGALELICAVNNIRESGFDLEVDIVGIDVDLIKMKYKWLRVYGYLDKQNPKDSEIYYSLLSDARLFVNTTSGWSGFQSLLEAMYFYNPIIVRPNESLISYFPNLMNFSYVLEGEGSNLEGLIIKSLSEAHRYEEMCMSARRESESYTWDNFIDKVIGLFGE